VRVVAAVPAIGLLAGCALGLFVPPAPAIVAGAVLCLECVAATLAWRRRSDRLFIPLVAIGFASGGSVLSSRAFATALDSPLRAAFDRLAALDRVDARRQGRFVPLDPSAFVLIEGTLRADAAPTQAGVSLSLAVERMGRFGDGGPLQLVDGRPRGALVTVGGSIAARQADQWRAGRHIRLPAELRRPARYLDEGVTDGERALQLRGTDLVGSTKSGALVDVVQRGSWLDETAAGLRARSRDAIDDAVGRWSPRSATIVKAIVIGDRGGLEPEVERSLQDAGTYHVIAISGGNIAILVALMLGAFRVAALLGRAAMAGAIGLLLAYAHLVGGGASVDRATWMAVVYLTARAADQRSPPLNTIALVAACAVVLDPLTFLNPAFILTFGATLAIVVAAPWSRRAGPWLRPVVAMLAASLAAEAVLLPVGALFFSRVTFAGLLLNFAAIPLMSVAQIAGMAVVPVAMVSKAAAAAAGLVAHVGAEGLVRSAAIVRLMPIVLFRVAPPPWPVVVLYYCALGAATTRRWRLPGTMAAVAAVFWMVAQPWTWLPQVDSWLHVTFLDVGQGDAAFIRFPRGTTMVVDSGGLTGSSAFDVGDRVVAPVLRRAGVRRVDYLVLTHGDPDHIGGAPAIVREFRPRHAWEGIPVPAFLPLVALRAEAQALGVSWNQVGAGDRYQLDGVELAILHPGPPDWERQRVRNDDSVVMELRWGDVSVVLTGDIGKAVEEMLVQQLVPAPLRIVKVPHHGSLTSSTAAFVEAAAPRVAVFSVGRSNRFGHPAAGVVERYERVGAEVLRTDRDGAVTVETDGQTLDIGTFTGRRLVLRAAAHHDATTNTKAPKP